MSHVALICQDAGQTSKTVTSVGLLNVHDFAYPVHGSTTGRNTPWMNTGSFPTMAPGMAPTGAYPSEGPSYWPSYCGDWIYAAMVGEFNLVDPSVSVYTETVPGWTSAMRGESSPVAYGCQVLCESNPSCTTFTAYDRDTSNCAWTDSPPYKLYSYEPQPSEVDEYQYVVSVVMCEDSQFPQGALLTQVSTSCYVRCRARCVCPPTHDGLP